MIQIRVEQHDQKIVLMKISGHAYTADPGKDLVCAAVSAIAFGLCNALDLMRQPCECSAENNTVLIKVQQSTDTAETILRTGLIQLQTVEEVHRDAVQIHILEV
ncbi:MAG: ribosomal-processing cysteine protease Prp [Solobacterium sp.]|nr:ribosomal-processing cysteine protease Prp [Solobacterium sp.]